MEEKQDEPASATKGRCPECRWPIDDHHFVIDPSVRGKSTDQGNRYYKCPHAPRPLEPDDGADSP